MPRASAPHPKRTKSGRQIRSGAPAAAARLAKANDRADGLRLDGIPAQSGADPSATPIKALATALRVLSQFVHQQGPLGVGDIADSLGLKKSQASKVLRTFRDFGLLDQDSDSRKYSVGLNAFALGNKYVNANPLSREALPIMRKLVDETGHSAVLSVMHNGDVIHLLAVEGRLFVDGRWRVGRWMPYHTTSAGKVLLAFGPMEAVDRLLKTRGLPRITPNTITDPREFKSALSKARAAGIAVTRSENFPGTAAVSVPVFDPTGRAVAALGLICPEHLLTRKEEARLAGPLHRAARELSFRIGAQIYPFGN